MSRIAIDQDTLDEFHTKQKDPKFKKNPERQRYLYDLARKYMLSTTEADRDTFEEGYNKAVLTSVDAVYIDFTLLYDIYLGALLLMHATSDKAFSYILSRMSAYHNSLDGLHAKYFPELNHTEDDLLTYMHAHIDKLILQSPPTSMWECLASLMHHIHTDNAITASIKGDRARTVSYLVNFYPFSPTLEVMKIFKVRLQLGLHQTKIDFRPFSCDPRYMDDEVYDVPKFFFVERIDDWFTDESKSKAKFIDGSFQMKVFGAKPLVTNPEVLREIYSYTYEQILDLERRTTSVLNLYTEFYYYRPIVTCFEGIFGDRKNL